MSVFLDAAYTYVARGVPIFPCAPHSKVPACAHGFHDATTDVERIERFWWRHPDANIAAPTGVEFDVVDFDALELYEQARAEHRLDGPQVRTARGAHFYVTPTGRPSTKLSPSIDYKGAGGYVLVPPSIHPSGVRYRWICRGDSQPAPGWLYELLERSRPTPRPTPRPPAGAPTPRAIASLRAMADRLAHCTPGNRNRFLFWCACTSSDTGASPDEVTIVLRDAARRAGLDDREIARTLDSAFARWQ